MPHINPSENLARLLDRNTLVWERAFRVPPAELWQAIATKESLSHWFMPTKFEIELGGRFSFEGGWDGTITELDPPRRIQFTAEDSNGYLRFEISNTAEGCLFTLTDEMGPGADVAQLFGPDTPEHLVHQPGGVGTHWSGIASGYHGFVDALEAYVEGTEAHFDDDEMARMYSALMDEWHSTQR